MQQTDCQELEKRFEAKAKAGLVDVKFFVANPWEAVKDEVCRELNSLYDAVERGDTRALDFNDSRAQ